MFRKVALVSVIALATQKDAAGPTGRWVTANALSAVQRECDLSCGERPTFVDDSKSQWVMYELSNPATGPMIALDLRKNPSNGNVTGTIGVGEHLSRFIRLTVDEASLSGKTIKFKTHSKNTKGAVEETSWLGELTSNGELTLREERLNKPVRTFSLRQSGN